MTILAMYYLIPLVVISFISLLTKLKTEGIN